MFSGTVHFTRPQQSGSRQLRGVLDGSGWQVKTLARRYHTESDRVSLRQQALHGAVQYRMLAAMPGVRD
jgi:hypothetical protein